MKYQTIPAAEDALHHNGFRKYWKVRKQTNLIAFLEECLRFVSIPMDAFTQVADAGGILLGTCTLDQLRLYFIQLLEDPLNHIFLATK